MKKTYKDHDQKFKTFIWSEVSINKKFLDNVFFEIDSKKDIIFKDTVQNNYKQFLESFAISDNPLITLKKTKDITIKHLFE